MQRWMPTFLFTVLLSLANAICNTHSLHESSGLIQSPDHPNSYPLEECTKWFLLNASNVGDRSLLIRLDEMNLTYVHSMAYRWCTGKLLVLGENICDFKSGTCLLFLPSNGHCENKNRSLQHCENLFVVSGSFPREIALISKDYGHGELRRFQLSYSYFSCQNASNSGNTTSETSCVEQNDINKPSLISSMSLGILLAGTLVIFGIYIHRTRKIHITENRSDVTNTPRGIPEKHDTEYAVIDVTNTLYCAAEDVNTML